jgi:hypothetical protein
METQGKPRDVAAAVSRSLAPVELAVVEEKPLDGGGREFLLVGSKGEEGVLRVAYTQGSAQELAWRREVIAMRLTARVGLFGNAARERDLVEKVSHELKTLGRQP